MSTTSINNHQSESPIRMPLCCPRRWLDLSLEDAASQVPLENLHLCSSYHPPIYNNYCCSKDRGVQRGSGAVEAPSAPYCSPESEPLVTAPQPCESNRASEEGGAVPDVAGPDGGEGKRWGTAELLPADKPFLQRATHRKGSSAPFPRSEVLLMTLLSCLSTGTACSDCISTILERRPSVQSHLDFFFF